MLTNFKFLILTLLMSASFGFAQTGVGSIKGTVTDRETGEELPFVKVVVFQNGNQKGFASTGLDGKFIIASLSPGEYDVELRFVGYQPKREEGVVVNSDKLTIRNYDLGATSEMLTEVEVVFYEVPLIDKDGGASGATVTRDDISKMSARSATEVAKTVGGVYQKEGDSGLNIRGTRSDATYYYIDGIKVRGSSSLPKSSIQEVAVITGGLPANYGDVTGGVISITTRGPSSKYFGSGEVVTSGFYLNGEDPLGYDGRVFGLDKYAYNLVEGMISGPLLSKKDSLGNKTGKPILGFFLSANARDRLDARPLHNGGAYRIKKEVRDDLLDYENGIGPLRPNSEGTGTYYNSNFLGADDFEQVPYRMNNRGQNYSASAKLDVNAGPTMNLTFGGSLNYSRNNQYNRTNSLLNFENFGEETNFDWRVFGRFTQRFNNNVEGSTSKIKSAYYSLMIDYSQEHNRLEDATHGDKLFNYGYVGKFKTYRENSYGFTADLDSLVLTGWNDTLVEFTAADNNPGFSAITSQYYNIYEGQTVGQFENLDQIRAGGALVNGDILPSVYGLWSSFGAPFSTYRFSQNDQLRVTGSGTINLNDHALTLGFEYEQRWDRDFRSNPAGLNGINPQTIWTISRLYLNSHITGIDRNDVSFRYEGTFPRVTYGRLNAAPGAYQGQEENDAQYFFDYSVRKALGEQDGLEGADLEAFIDGTDFINLDELDPNFFNLAMFSPDDLLNSGQQYFGWRGYDHTGEKVRGATDIQKYFTEYDDNGNLIRKIGAYQPIYISGYIMDKFAFDDIIFNVGLRADIFDANQPVLKDKYLVYGAKTVKEVSTIGGSDVSHPENISEDAVVYVDDIGNTTKINGYRDGDIWYDATGLEVDNSAVIQGSEGIAPLLNDPSATSPNPTDFDDYKAQFNLMPRIAFSFPISDEASFFAHYDILTKRPTGRNVFDPTDYQFVNTRSIIIDNPNLLPEKTIDYEIGFQQVLTKTSSIKISAFYKEQRDQVQLQRITDAYPASYTTFGNRDFGTIKGTTVSYDLRRTGNIRINASYTLQFANGTGSDDASALSLINAGEPNLRNILPYNFDQRHAFNLVVDYRYGGGKDYKGPKIKNFGVFENTGLNVQANLGSGTPYSRQQIITAESLATPQTSGLEGTLNGSNLPWSYRVDAQLDRNFKATFGGKDENDKKKVAYLNVYLRVNNVFNFVNVINVYRGTGNPTDDGFLLSALGQNVAGNQLNTDSYSNYYSLRTNNLFNLGIPRTIRLGVKFDF
ncbi:MAG: carboxypeptidase regulatory-like domain-containing protein [Crocinitomicaceae bacterium]